MEGSLITIGCFTECLDAINRKTAIDMIIYFLQQGNYIQISTKKKIDDKDIAHIAKNIQYENQMNIYISLPTLSYARTFEPDVDCLELRIENLDLKHKHGINTYLYIKPVLESITIKDKAAYAQLVRKYQIPAVIGELIYPTTDDLAHFLEQYTVVYRHSNDVIKQIRGRAKAVVMKVYVIPMKKDEVEIRIPEELQSYNFADEYLEIQNLYDQPYEKITVRFVHTMWIDNLAMIQLILILYKLTKLNKKIFFELEIDPEAVEQIRFVKYMDDYGFLSVMAGLSGKKDKYAFIHSDLKEAFQHAHIQRLSETTGAGKQIDLSPII